MELSALLDGFDRRDWEHSTDVETVRFAVVGLGGFARDFSLPSLAASDYCEATVAVSGSPEKAETVVDEHDVDRATTYDEYHDGAATGAYDAVYVVTPHALHQEHVETAVRRVSELVDGGFIGDPVQVHGDFPVPVLDDPDEPAGAWRLDGDLAGGSALIDLGLYPLNTVRYVLAADATEVYGRTRSPHAAFADLDEHVSCTVALDTGENEVDAVPTASQQATVSSQLKFVGTEGETTLEPVFYESKPRRLTLRRNGLRCAFTVEPVDPLVEQFDYFAHCLQTGAEPEPDVRHGLRDMELVDAIYRSAEENEPRAV